MPISKTPYDNKILLNSLNFVQQDNNQRSPIQFSFQSFSFREQFYSSSTYEITLGFLQAPNVALKTSNNFRCIVYENEN
jgi:hypothetical protein